MSENSIIEAVINIFGFIIIFLGIGLFGVGVEKLINTLNRPLLVIVSVLVSAGWFLILNPLAGIIGWDSLSGFVLACICGFIFWLSLSRGMFCVLIYLLKYFHSVSQWMMLIFSFYILWILLSLISSLFMYLPFILMALMAIIGFCDICKELYKRFKKQSTESNVVNNDEI